MFASYRLLMLLAFIPTFVLLETEAAYGQGLGIKVRDSKGTIIGRQGAAGNDPLEPGLFAAPILAVDAILLASLLLHRRDLLGIKRSINRILPVDTSKRITAVILIALLVAYTGFSVKEIFDRETFSDFEQLDYDVERWSSDEVGIIGAGYLLSIDYMLFGVSLYVFGSIRLIPFLASVAFSR